MPDFHTLNARDNSLVHWIYSQFARSDASAFRTAIQTEAENLRGLLASRSVRYDDLKSALVPTRDGRQVVFLYDWLDDPSLNYAVAFAKLYLPHLRKTLRTSMLHGDLHDFGGPIPIQSLDNELVRSGPGALNWRTHYAVYFTNLRDDDVTTLHEALVEVPRYRGYIDVSREGPVRDYLDRTVAHEWVMTDDKILLDHGGDEPYVSDQDPVGFDLQAFGYQVVSVIDFYFAAFLSYKIEAQDAFQASEDRDLTLAAATGAWLDVDAASVVVPPEKLVKYLLRDEGKLRLMTSIGLQDVTADELAKIIKAKMSQSYLYDFRDAPDGASVFAVSAEFEKVDGGSVRRLLALKYDKGADAISLVSMY
ncbi:hypothetical protein [Microbacterium murale]|uniref:hypothetical protein n=1 Tax=Microbacterium murale TaxID=1081040 RepID=UPI0016636200|nr:hypothetical protein [Microbacterium murale]